MRDLLVAGSAWLHQQRERFLTRAVTYRRGATTRAVDATLGRTVFRLDLGHGVLERTETRDYLISSAQFAGGGPPFEPQRGDQICEDDPARGRRWVYAVLAPGGEPPWRWSDPERTTLRIHTKHIASEPL